MFFEDKKEEATQKVEKKLQNEKQKRKYKSRDLDQEVLL